MAGLRVLPCGEHALLVEVDDPDERLALARSLQQTPVPGLLDVVPGARTVLLDAAPGTDLRALAAEVLVRDLADHVRRDDAPPVRVDVRYNGADLDAVAELLGCSRDAVVAAHSGQVWTVAFCGFAPGFGYLTAAGGDVSWDVPRRAESRTRVPAGSVGLAGEYSGVYPTASPGGWQLIGRTDAVLWDLDRDPPALFRPGGRVHFRAVRDLPTAAVRP